MVVIILLVVIILSFMYADIRDYVRARDRYKSNMFLIDMYTDLLKSIDNDLATSLAKLSAYHQKILEADVHNTHTTPEDLVVYCEKIIKDLPDNYVKCTKLRTWLVQLYPSLTAIIRG